MKPQYLIGQDARLFIRVIDGVYSTFCSLTLEEAKEMKKHYKGFKIYKLVKVKE